MKELIQIQTELNCPKTQYNSFGKYYFRNCEDIVNGIKPFLKELGCYLLLTDNIQMVGDRTYVVATATITNEQGQSVAATAWAREADMKKGMDVAQITGAASSYARKYALGGLLGIDDMKDSDSLNKGDKQNQQQNQQLNQQLNQQRMEAAKPCSAYYLCHASIKKMPEAWAKIKGRYYHIKGVDKTDQKKWAALNFEISKELNEVQQTLIRPKFNLNEQAALQQ